VDQRRRKVIKKEKMCKEEGVWFSVRKRGEDLENVLGRSEIKGCFPFIILEGWISSSFDQEPHTLCVSSLRNKHEWSHSLSSLSIDILPLIEEPLDEIDIP
jgi:hypothetical protein